MMNMSLASQTKNRSREDASEKVIPGASIPKAAQITPGIVLTDKHANYWLQVVNIRIRREVMWTWQLRQPQNNVSTLNPAPSIDPATENLDIVRFSEAKQYFFESDDCAKYLTDQLNGLTVDFAGESLWERIVEHLALDDASQFILALSLAAKLDSALAPIICSIMNDLSRPFPSFALAQKLWEEPLDIIACMQPSHPLMTSGLLQSTEQHSHNKWTTALEIATPIFEALVSQSHLEHTNLEQKNLEKTIYPSFIEPIYEHFPRTLTEKLQTCANSLSTAGSVHKKVNIVALLHYPNCEVDDWLVALSQQMQQTIVKLKPFTHYTLQDLKSIFLYCQIQRLAIAFPPDWLNQNALAEQFQLLSNLQSMVTGDTAQTVYLPTTDKSVLNKFAALPHAQIVSVPNLDYETRVQLFKHYLGAQAVPLKSAIAQAARRYRVGDKIIAQIAQSSLSLADNKTGLTTQTFLQVCQQTSFMHLGQLAQPVKPRFKLEDLVLPPTSMQQFNLVLQSMQQLANVHYDWGTAKAWNESGLSVMFCGPSGTGKTMAAEILANTLDLPMFRVDLSQVVNKYIGETEKNLARIFDTAEQADCILFFDEADAIFGKRTDVKDAHDRFANIEISYLLERMERFKGLSILATNRRKDLDEAFLRRLRYIIEFPAPGAPERKKLWQTLFPEQADTKALDIDFLAKQFQFCGGHIRSITLNACLQAAHRQQDTSGKEVSMQDVVVSIKRELEKLDRSAHENLFGQYAQLLTDVEGDNDKKEKRR